MKKNIRLLYIGVKGFIVGARVIRECFLFGYVTKMKFSGTQSHEKQSYLS